MIMSVLGIFCYLILYFPVNRGLAINLLWPAHKNKGTVVIRQLPKLYDILRMPGPADLSFSFSLY